MRKLLVLLFLLPSVALAQPIPGNTSSVTGAVTCNAGTNLNTSSLATSSKQDTGNASLDSIDGKIAVCDTDDVTVSSSALPTGAATESTLSTLNGKVTACNTGAVTVSSSALPTGASTSAKQDTIIGHIDGVETSLSTIAGAVSGTEMQVDVLTLPSISGTVTCNAGTNLNTSSLATEATLSTLNGKVTACNTGAVTISTSLPAGTNAIGKLSANSGVDIGDVDITSIAAGNNNIGDVDVASIAAGNNNIGDVDVASIAAGTNTIGGVRLKPDTTGGYTIARFIDLDEADQQIKGTAGQLYGYYLYNNAASTRFFKFYNATAASVSVGTTTPVLTIPVPAGSAANVEFSVGIAFATAITAACTTGIADADTGAPSANDCVANIFYN